MGKVSNKIFCQFATDLLSKILAAGKKAHCTAVVFDDYLNVSIKSVEPDRRSSRNQLLFKTIVSSAVIKQWTLFLSCIDNENALIAFVVSEWKKEKYRLINRGQMRFI